MALRRLIVKTKTLIPQARVMQRSFADQNRSVFDDKEEAHESAYIRKEDKKRMESLLQKIHREEAELSGGLAKAELMEIIPGIPQDVIDRLMAWKDKYPKREPKYT